MQRGGFVFGKLFIRVLVLACLPASFGQAQETAVAVAEQLATERSQADVDADVASFDKVWETIRDRNWEEDFDLEHWQTMKAEYRPRVEASKSIQDTRKILGELILTLEKSHYGIIPNELYDKIKSAKELKEEENDGEEEEDDEIEGESGLSFRAVGDLSLVTNVEAGSGAEKAGIRPGWALLKYKDQDVSALYEELKEELPPTSPIRPDTITAMALEQKLEGDDDESVELTFLDENDEKRVITITYQPRTGKTIQFGHLPEMHVKSKSRVIDESIGYAWFSVFFDPVTVMKDISTAIKAAKSGDGFILDMRGNHGGLAGMTMGVGNHFVKDKKSYLGTLTTKENALKFVLIPRARPYDGPVAVLVDECSISSAEILAGGLQAIGRAKIFGVQSAGLALPSTVEMLPNKDRFQFAIAGYTDSEGRNIEGTGVTPDVPVTPTRKALLAGEDPILDAAVAWIKTEAKAGDDNN